MVKRKLQVKKLSNIQKAIVFISFVWVLLAFLETSGVHKRLEGMIFLCFPLIVYWFGVWLFGFGYIVKIIKALFKSLTSKRKIKINSPKIFLIMGLSFLAINIKEWLYSSNVETSYQQEEVQESQKMNFDYVKKQSVGNTQKSPIAISLSQMEKEDQAMLNRARYLASQITPDEAKEIKDLAEKNNITFELAKADKVRLKTDDMFKKMQDVRKQTPYLARLVGESTYASLSQEDIDNLTLEDIDKLMKRLKDARFMK